MTLHALVLVLNSTKSTDIGPVVAQLGASERVRLMQYLYKAMALTAQGKGEQLGVGANVTLAWHEKVRQTNNSVLELDTTKELTNDASQTAHRDGRDRLHQPRHDGPPTRVNSFSPAVNKSCPQKSYQIVVNKWRRRMMSRRAKSSGRALLERPATTPTTD